MDSPFKIVDSGNQDSGPKIKDIVVKHDPIGQKFFITLEPSEAVLAYTQINDILDVHTVIVPEVNRGQGLGEQLAVAAFEYVREHHMKIIPTCPYINNTFLKKHPEYASFITSY